jgi:hypothetical protein
VPGHPNQLAAARDRYRSGGGTSDSFDAYALAELARTGMHHRLSVLEPDAHETRTLRALTQAREDLVAQRVRPSEADPPICLAFLERHPSPQDAHSLGAQQLAAFVARHSYCRRRSTAEQLGRLRSAPESRAGEPEAKARRAVVLGLVAAPKPLVDQIKLLTSQVRGLLAGHPDSATPHDPARHGSLNRLLAAGD